MSYAPGSGPNDSIPVSATRVELHGPDENLTATLRTHEGKTLCELPCTADIPDASKYYVDVPLTEKKSKRVEIPDTIEGAKGTKTAFTAVPRKGSPRGALGVAMGGVAFFAVGLILIGGNCGPAPPGTSISDAVSREGACTGGFVSLGLGALIGAGGLAWLLYSSSAHLEPRTPSTPATTSALRLIPGGLAF
jgi:hypothetical protein